MSGMEDTLSAMLGNPAMMENLMNMARSVGQAPMQPPAVPPAAIDEDQRRLLQALRPYLSQSRLQRLEKAMRAAKMAALASSLLENQEPGR